MGTGLGFYGNGTIIAHLINKVNGFFKDIPKTLIPIDPFHTNGLHLIVCQPNFFISEIGSPHSENLDFDTDYEYFHARKNKAPFQPVAWLLTWETITSILLQIGLVTIPYNWCPGPLYSG